MLTNYLIVNEKVLPEVFGKVIEVKNLLETGECENISDAVKKVGISRSAYYKYKDHVFTPDNATLMRKSLISFVLSDEKGILSRVLNEISASGGNVLTINQNIPIQKKANVIVSIDIKDLHLPIEELLKKIDEISGVSKITLLSIE
ncbi:ACT domain-containing protein [Vagococcus sp.]|uniref:ACT domain-containing protein n=1 Tax=Vagococcus sp. TaxID=1933889 RepID=UPI003F98CF20